MKKKLSSCGSPNTEIVTLASDRAWSDLKSHILSHIRTALNCPSPNLDDYNITFTVTRHVTDPVQLGGKEKYEYMVRKALLLQKFPNAKIVVEPKVRSCFVPPFSMTSILIAGLHGDERKQ
jgi:hypothetical protein